MKFFGKRVLYKCVNSSTSEGECGTHSEPMVCGLGDPVSKVFLIDVSGKHVPFKCVNGGTSEGECSTRV